MNFADNNILLILISLVFIYATLSILVSILMEWFNYLTKERGKHLKESIHNLLHDGKNASLGTQFYDHVTIAGLSSLKNRLPDYISSDMFSEAFVDIIAEQNTDPTATSADSPVDQKILKMMTRFESGVNAMQPSPFKNLMVSFIDKSGKDYTVLKSHLENWYNDYMERVSGWYKLNQRTKLIFIGFVVAIGLNVDSLHLIKVLSLDDNVKNRIVEQADVTVDRIQDSTKNISADGSKQNDELLAMIQPVESTNKAAVAPKATTQYFNQVEKLMLLNDSLETKQTKLKDTVLQHSVDAVNQFNEGVSVLQQLNVPIGWSCNSAPLSWIKCCKYNPTNAQLQQASQTPGIITYLDHRNSTSGDGNFWKYLIGIVISGVSLSFGAPFWFDLLVKLVNVRRSGNVPEVVKK